jgi:N-acetyl-gamma-glutamyl-phosphate reductase
MTIRRPDTPLRIGIYGATGYTGLELVRILGRHPAAAIHFLTAHRHAGGTLRDVFPGAPPLPLLSADDAPLDDVDVVFLCLPHAAAAESAVVALNAGARVIDLSADFRLLDAAVYARWYNHTHPAPERLAEAVYGLTEAARDRLPGARLVANPGCYPTSILLPLRPILCAGVSLAGPIIADAKSGVSGAGRAPTPTTHFVSVADNLSPYKIGRAHRHLPEMEQQMQTWLPGAPPLVFSPHLLPVPRGMLSTIYLTPGDGTTAEDVRGLLGDAYDGEPFIELLPPGEAATLAHVTHTNRCAIGVADAGGTIILTSAIDNLIKGASGQAVQNMNVVFDLPETAGLL